jgi:hypothetical protein
MDGTIIVSSTIVQRKRCIILVWYVLHHSTTKVLHDGLLPLEEMTEDFFSNEQRVLRSPAFLVLNTYLFLGNPKIRHYNQTCTSS